MDDLNELLQYCGFQSRQEMFLVLYLRELGQHSVEPDDLSSRIGIDPMTLDEILERLRQNSHLTCHNGQGPRYYTYQSGTPLSARVDELADIQADPLRRHYLEMAWRRHVVHAASG